MQAEIPEGALELASLMRVDGGDRNTGLSPAAAMGTFGFVFAGARHLTGVGRVQRERVNAATTALQGNHRRSNRSCLRRHRERNDTAAGLGTRSTTTSHCEENTRRVARR